MYVCFGTVLCIYLYISVPIYDYDRLLFEAKFRSCLINDKLNEIKVTIVNAYGLMHIAYISSARRRHSKDIELKSNR